MSAVSIPAAISVPNVVGQAQATATTTITNANLTVGAVTMQPSGTVTSGNVISENPAAQASVAFGTAVSLVISSGFFASSATETVLYSFGASNTEAGSPIGLIQGTDGNFYGIDGGGVNGSGAFFKITPAGAQTVLYSFGSSSTDGYGPNSVIQGADGNFFGTTQAGGAHGVGTVFEITPAGMETVLYSFGASITDGFAPNNLIQGTDGDFYGTTFDGGANLFALGMPGHGAGTFFSITPAGVETVLYSFGASSTDGNQPSGFGLIQGTDGNFYGTTTSTGNNPSVNPGGTFFRITPAGVETVLHSFGVSSTDGSYPRGLIQGSDGNFYGTTGAGGANPGSANEGDGTVFKITPAGVETVLHSFGASNTDGSGPGGLIRGSDGDFYGITYYGGANPTSNFPSGTGAFFRITPAGVETVLYSFGASNIDGTVPDGVIQGADGNFYGVTDGGGTNHTVSDGDGTYFELSP